jgi:acetoacetate decarboxylase
MTAPSLDYAGGQVQLRADKPTGLPFLQPLYEPGPYDYTNGMVLFITYQCDEAALRECLPRQLEPLEGNYLAMTFFVWPEVTGMGPHSFSMPVVPVRYGDFQGSWIPYLYTSTDRSLACYREVQGWPAVLGSVELTEASGRVRAKVIRNGREIIAASAEVSDEPGDLGEFPPVILYKEIPSIDGSGTDVATFLTSTSKFTNVAFRNGTGTLSFPDPGADPIARLQPLQIVGASYGTMDDHYPETIRLLDPLT